MTTMYRLRSHIEDSLGVGFDDLSDMTAYVTEHQISDCDATMEEWIDDRINPENSAYAALE